MQVDFALRTCYIKCDSLCKSESTFSWISIQFNLFFDIKETNLSVLSIIMYATEDFATRRLFSIACVS